MPGKTLAGPGPDDISLSWDAPVWHPQVRPGSPYEAMVAVPGTIREPLCLGADPETGRPLTLRLWDPAGRQGRCGRLEDGRRDDHLAA